MEEIYIKARAKINLNLEILNKREDNYHNIKSVFQKINLYDEIFIKKSNIDGIELQTNIEGLNNEENIVYKAYYKLKEKYKDITGIKVIINKKIPMQAGLGGGSTDCASFIFSMNKLFNLKLSKKEIENIGKSLGADVVPCLYNKAVLAEGIGDIITPIDTKFKYYIVIVKPNLSCNTREMYELIDKRKELRIIDKSTFIINGLKNNNLKQISNNLHNRFEDIIEKNKYIKEIKCEMIRNGALGSLMTGAGSCVYGLFENKKTAKSAYENFKKKYQTYICTSYNSKSTL